MPTTTVQLQRKRVSDNVVVDWLLNADGSDPTADAAVLAKLEVIRGIVAGVVTTKDDYQTGECLADQTGTGGVLTFTFTNPMNLIVIEAKGVNLTARADAFGGTPNASLGIVCDDGVPTYIPVVSTVVKIFAPSGIVVSVFGLRRI